MMKPEPRWNDVPTAIRLLFRGLAWALVLLITASTLLPVEFRPTTAAPADFERFCAFAGLGGAFALGYPNTRLGYVSLAIGIAGALELLQHVVPGRHGQMQDFIMKAAGAAVGGMLAGFCERVWSSRC